MEFLVIAVVGGVVLAIVLFRLIQVVTSQAVDNLTDGLVYTFGDDTAVNRRARGGPQIAGEVVSATFHCAACGEVAATVHYVPPFARDPQYDAEPSVVPLGAADIGQEKPRISIAGGPVSVTISREGNWADEAIAALRAHDAKAMRAIDHEFVPFWCSRCEQPYCKSHWRIEHIFDEGFFDCIKGTCPEGHRQMLID